MKTNITIESARTILENSRGAQLLKMHAENSRDAYASFEWLANCIAKKQKRGTMYTTEHLAECATMASIMRDIAKEVARNEAITPSMDDRRAIACIEADYILTDLVPYC